MNNAYISKKTAIDAIFNVLETMNDGDTVEFANLRDAICECDSAEVIPARCGEWVDKPSGAYGRWQSWCSVCGKHSGIGGIESNRHRKFCPNCGARMKRIVVYDNHKLLGGQDEKTDI